ncbi:hypothetical protein Q1695_012655 [Nippostrongylus brasiliensis]|nr:hypothetical protein Q1695_012655 [Nippostrongylus brasiliensis]
MHSLYYSTLVFPLPILEGGMAGIIILGYIQREYVSGRYIRCLENIVILERKGCSDGFSPCFVFCSY